MADLDYEKWIMMCIFIILWRFAMWIMLSCRCARDVSVLLVCVWGWVKVGCAGLCWATVFTPPVGCPLSPGHGVMDTLGLVYVSGVPL